MLVARLAIFLHLFGVSSAFVNPNPTTQRITTSNRRQSVPLQTVTNPESSEDLKAVKRKLTTEFFKVGTPAFIQLAAEPLASLIDTVYLGKLGGAEILGGVGVAISAQYAVSKLYNDPLLRSSISLVASQDGKARGKEADEDQTKQLSIAVSTGSDCGLLDT